MAVVASAAMVLVLAALVIVSEMHVKLCWRLARLGEGVQLFEEELTPLITAIHNTH